MRKTLLVCTTPEHILLLFSSTSVPHLKREANFTERRIVNLWYYRQSNKALPSAVKQGTDTFGLTRIICCTSLEPLYYYSCTLLFCFVSHQMFHYSECRSQLSYSTSNYYRARALEHLSYAAALDHVMAYRQYDKSICSKTESCA